MADYSSDVQLIPYSAERVFTKLSDLNNLESVRQHLEEKVRNFTFDKNSCSFNIDPVGTIGIRIVEREPFKTIRLESAKSPIEFSGSIQLQEASPEVTQLRLILKADIPIFLRAMISHKLEEGITKLAETLAKMPY